MAPKILMSSRTGRGGEIADGLEKNGLEVVIVPRKEPPSDFHIPDADEIAREWSQADGFVFTGRDLVTREALAGAPNLKIGASSVIGTENIDVQAATELGIAIGFGATPENYLGVAEAVVMLTAALLKRLPAKWEALKSGGYRVDEPGRMVRGSTIGLIGLGNVGQGVARRLQGWETNMIASDPYIDPGIAERLGVKLVDLDTLLQEADVVSVMVVLTDETRGLIGERELALMKPGSYLINTSRGPCADQAAVDRALESGHLGGAALDVWQVEPTPADNPLRTNPRVIATGHNVGHSDAVYASLGPACIENIVRGMRGEPPLHFRNPEVLERWQERLQRLGVLQAQHNR
jgi:D-3-phosphoglycerate dehydrogenase